MKMLPNRQQTFERQTWISSLEPEHSNSYKTACASSEDIDQPAHQHSLISLPCPLKDALEPWLSKGPDQTAGIWSGSTMSQVRRCIGTMAIQRRCSDCWSESYLHQQVILYEREALVTRNLQANYESSIWNGSKVMTNVNTFFKVGQGHHRSRCFVWVGTLVTRNLHVKYIGSISNGSKVMTS